jgi:hypothetical protein
MKCWGKLLAVFLIGLQIPSYSFASTEITPEEHEVHVANVNRFILNVSQIENCQSPHGSFQNYYCQLYKNYQANGLLDPQESWNTEIASAMITAGLAAILVSDAFLYRYELITIEKLNALDEILISDKERFSHYLGCTPEDRNKYYPKNKGLNRITSKLFSSISVTETSTKKHIIYSLMGSPAGNEKLHAELKDFVLIYKDLSKIPFKQHHAYMGDFNTHGHVFIHETPEIFKYKVDTYYPSMLLKIKTRNFLKIVGYPLSAAGIGLLLYEHMYIEKKPASLPPPTPDLFLGWIQHGDIESIRVYLLDPYPQIAKDISDKINTIPPAWNAYKTIPVHSKTKQ